MGFGRKSWFRYRVVIYALVVVGLLLYRNQINWSRLTAAFKGDGPAEKSLVLAGRDLAPGLVDVLVEHYRRDYPDLDIRTQGGGTNQALEDLVNRRADVAFLSGLRRRPSRICFFRWTETPPWWKRWASAPSLCSPGRCCGRST